MAANANPDAYRLTEAEHQSIFDQDIKPDLFAGAKMVERPVAVIFGGQPGAGKSPAVDAALRELEQRGGAVVISGDDMRAYHPHFARLMAVDDKTAAFYTDRDMGAWVEKAIAEAQDRRVNIVVEGTMRDANKVAATMLQLREADYQIEARALAVNERLSQQGILQRYEHQKADRGAGRMTTPQAHQAAFDGMPITLERIESETLADRVTVYRRGGAVIYSNVLQGQQWSMPAQARSVVDQERDRAMTLAERRDYARDFERLSELMTRPQRQASADEVKAMEDLRMRAQRELVAEVFRQVPQAKAIAQYPELGSAYAYVRATEAKAVADGLNAQQLTIVSARVVDNVAARIERGEIKPTERREAEDPRVTQNQDRER